VRTFEEIQSTLRERGFAGLSVEETAAYYPEQSTPDPCKMITAFYTESVQCGDKTITQTASLTFPETIDARSVIRALKAEIQSRHDDPII